MPLFRTVVKPCRTACTVIYRSSLTRIPVAQRVSSMQTVCSETRSAARSRRKYSSRVSSSRRSRYRVRCTRRGRTQQSPLPIKRRNSFTAATAALTVAGALPCACVSRQRSTWPLVRSSACWASHQTRKTPDIMDIFRYGGCCTFLGRQFQPVRVQTIYQGHWYPSFFKKNTKAHGELSSSPWKKHGIIVCSPVQSLTAVVAEGLVLTFKATSAARTYRKGCIVFTVGGATAVMCNRHAETVGQLLASGIDLRLSAGIVGCVTKLSHSKVIVTGMYMARSCTWSNQFEQKHARSLFSQNIYSIGQNMSPA